VGDHGRDLSITRLKEKLQVVHMVIISLISCLNYRGFPSFMLVTIYYDPSLSIGIRTIQEIGLTGKTFFVYFPQGRCVRLADKRIWFSLT
jgi:hypothetical protein